MKSKHIAIAGLAALMLTGCSTKRSSLTYFEDIDTVTTPVEISFDQFQTKIEPDDELMITVNSLSPGLTAPYNLPNTNPAKAAAGVSVQSTPQNATYIVDSKGDILFPELGTIHVEGMTLEQLRDLITERVAVEVKNPIVTVRLVNFSVDVAGEVKHPGRLNVTRERYSILDALTEAGDLTEYGERNNVLLVREENGKRVAHRLDLNSADLLASPYFYVKQNDYIYVQPNKIQQDNSKYNQNSAFKLSVISTIVSAASVVASLVIALSVK